MKHQTNRAATAAQEKRPIIQKKSQLAQEKDPIKTKNALPF
jgi:hypothetical protein